MKAGDLNWTDVNLFVLPNALVTDVTVAMPWSSIETSQGVYDFNTFDQQINHFIAFGKKVNIVTQPISPSGNNKFTPAYIFTPEWAASLGTTALDVITCSNFQGNDTPNSGMPVPYELPFKQGQKNFKGANPGYAGYTSAYLKAITDASLTSDITVQRDNSNGYAIYPDPANENITISITHDGIKTIQIYNILGQLVYNTETKNKQLSVNTSAFIKGYYNVRIKEGTNCIYCTLKFVRK